MMPTYTFKIGGAASKEQFREWRASGHFTGSFENYLAFSLPNEITEAREVTWEQYKNLIKKFPQKPRYGFMRGNLGPHCADCSCVGDYLCDYPVGDNKTCDRAMCDDHAHVIGNDLHYCDTHRGEWEGFVESGGVDESLKNVIAISRWKK